MVLPNPVMEAHFLADLNSYNILELTLGAAGENRLPPKFKVRVLHPIQLPGHTGTDLQHCHLWGSNPHRVDSL